MARPLTCAERDELGPVAYELSVKGRSQRAIARELGVAPDTARSLLKEQREQRRRERCETAERVLDGLDAAIAESWRRLEQLPPDSASNAAPGLLNALNSMLRTKTEILGFKAPTKTRSELTHRHERLDLSGFSDEELVTFERLVNKAAYPAAQAGQLYELDENGLSKSFEGARETG